MGWLSALCEWDLSTIPHLSLFCLFWQRLCVSDLPQGASRISLDVWEAVQNRMMGCDIRKIVSVQNAITYILFNIFIYIYGLSMSSVGVCTDVLWKFLFWFERHYLILKGRQMHTFFWALLWSCIPQDWSCFQEQSATSLHKCCDGSMFYWHF